MADRRKPLSSYILAPPLYVDMVAPRGFLDQYRESHALWYYYTLARKAYEEIIADPIVLEGDRDPTANFRQLFTSIAKLYGVQPEAMAKCWPQIDMQCFALNLPKLPDEERYRFASKGILQ